MILIWFIPAIIINIAYFLAGFYIKLLERNRIFGYGKILVRFVDLFTILLISYFLTHEFYNFINVTICLIVIYLSYYIMRINKSTWYFSIILVLLPLIALIAMSNLNKYIVDFSFEIVFGILLLVTSHNLLEDKKYKWQHYISLILGIIVAIYFVRSGTIPFE